MKFQLAFVQSLSHLQLCNPWATALLGPKDIIYCSHGLQASLSLTNFWCLLKLMSLELMMPSNHLFCHPLLLLPSVLPSIRIFSIESAFHIRWPKYWSFSFSISPSNEYSGLISFRIDWFDLFAVQGTLKSLLQHHNLKASIHWHSDFFMVQLSYPYTTTGKTTTVIIWTFVDKVTSLLLNMVSGFVIAFLPRSKCLLISWLLISVTVCSDFGAQENKICHCFHFFPF